MDPKPYLVIARKYRPQTFDDVAGQEAVATTLKNAISLGRIGHAYLFTGPRGVGKTSMARIFAKALNCKNGPTVTPCGKCTACQEIESARALDVLEIDGASNRGIDEIRALRENVKFAPAAGKYKIYIIDEVHQITTDGFNALLKTLEEPPAHVKFVFATTSASKVPATILSRCQRFDFRRIPVPVIVETLKEICKKEKIKIDEEALFAIAKAADGSLRDSQSILDQIAASAGDKITRQTVTQSLGSLEEEKLFEVMDALAAEDAKAALFVLDDVLKEGKDPSLFLERMLEHARNLLFVKVSDSLADLVEASDSYKKNLARQKELFTKEDLFYYFAVITHALSTMKRFEMKRVPIEIALIKLAHKTPMEPLAELIDKVRSSAASPAVPKNPAPAARPSESAPKASAASVDSPTPQERLPRRMTGRRAAEDEESADREEELPSGDIVLPSAVEEKSADLEAVWQPLLRALKNEKISVASYLAEGEPKGIRGNIALISFPEKLSFHRETLEAQENKFLIEKHLTALIGKNTRVEFESVKELSGKNGAGLPDDAPGVVSAEPDGAVKAAMNLFGGRIIK